MRIVKYNNNNNKVFPSLMNQFFNDDLRMNVINNNHSVPSVNSIENDKSLDHYFEREVQFVHIYCINCLFMFLQSYFYFCYHVINSNY